MRPSNWMKLIALLLLIDNVHAQAPVEHNVNASTLGAGSWRIVDWNAEAAQTPLACDIYCTYRRISTAKMAPQTLWSYAPLAWPDNPTNAVPSPATTSQPLPTPKDEVDANQHPIVYDSTMWERGAVDYYRSGDATVTAKVFQSGNQVPNAGEAAAVAAWHVQVQNQTTSGRDYFIRFIAPQSLRSVNIAYKTQNNMLVPIAQQEAKSRSAVDLLVDGLPVWSTSSNYFYPSTYTGGPYGSINVDWGSESTNDKYTIFIGRFAAGATFNIDYIVRADSYARAPNCGVDSDPSNGPAPKVHVHCFTLLEGRDLPYLNSAFNRFEIYSKIVSTLPIQIGL